MTFPSNPYNDINLFQGIIPTSNYCEMLFENDSNGNPIYIGFSTVTSAIGSMKAWYIIKLTYSGTYLTRVQTPYFGPNWNYIWDDRATYF